MENFDFNIGYGSRVEAVPVALNNTVDFNMSDEVNSNKCYTNLENNASGVNLYNNFEQPEVINNAFFASGVFSQSSNQVPKNGTPGPANAVPGSANAVPGSAREAAEAAKANAEQIQMYSDKIRNTLSLKSRGKLLLKRKVLEVKDRKYVVKAVSELIIKQRSGTLRGTDYTNWVAAIKLLFPWEDKAVYYARSSQGRGCRSFGILYNKVQNELASRRKCMREEEADNLEVTENAAVNAQDNEINTDDTPSEENPTNTEMQCSIELLQKMREVDEITTNLWIKTSSTRLSNQNISISEYMTLYPCLLTATGLNLLAKDFGILYPDKIDCVYELWPTLASKIIQAALKGKVKELNDYEGYEDSAKSALLLPFLFASINISSPRGEKKSCKPSRKAMQKWFILQVLSMNDLENQLEKLRNETIKFNQTLQPLMAIIGDPSEDTPLAYYVIINDVRYLQPDFLTSLSNCFKSFFSLHASYPAVCSRVWNYIQKVVFNIETSYDLNISQISSVVAATKF